MFDKLKKFFRGEMVHPDDYRVKDFSERFLAQGFGYGSTRSMFWRDADDRELNVFNVMTTAEEWKLPISLDILMQEKFQSVAAWCVKTGLQITDHAIAVIAVTVKNHGDVVMYVTALRSWQRRDPASTVINVEVLKEFFPLRFPSRMELDDRWERQKEVGLYSGTLMGAIDWDMIK